MVKKVDLLKYMWFTLDKDEGLEINKKKLKDETTEAKYLVFYVMGEIHISSMPQFLPHPPTATRRRSQLMRSFKLGIGEGLGQKGEAGSHTK